jgi:hypothetical protein
MKKYITLSVPLFFPLLTSAQDFNLSGSTFSTVISYVINLINLLIPILFAMAFIFFFWGLSKYVIGADSKTIKQGREYMMWGVLAIFILISYKAIIGIASGELNFGSGAPNQNNSLLPE